MPAEFLSEFLFVFAQRLFGNVHGVMVLKDKEEAFGKRGRVIHEPIIGDLGRNLR